MVLDIVGDVLLGTVLIPYYWLESLVLWLVPLRFQYKDISGQVVLVTGGGSGIGRIMCLRFSRLNCKVVTWDVNAQGNEETVKMIQSEGGTAYAYKVDLCNREEIYETAKRVEKEVGKVTILVNNAGIVTGKRFLECSDDAIQRTMDVNVNAHFWTTKAFLPGMLKRSEGHVVTIASLAGLWGVNRLVDYCASKFAAIGFDEALRTELKMDGHKGIKTTVVCPYFIDTGMFEGVKSRILPILKPEYVVDKIMSGVLSNQEMVIIPGYSSFLLFLKAILPSNGLFKLLQTFGASEAMDEFTGRAKKVL
ncbi:unnamed protein product [Darwinula stevensoni]|uniref:Uncharacterized protein n=1 Tax=Darwinula stevensoni TaxID=69355 RepID=A0A7R8X0S6_9CRUS|nr:unnamed protein product [Darwinula stevensoni]CAG0881500.1 unnamed protein product [Darwinula stevensoni]